MIRRIAIGATAASLALSGLAIFAQPAFAAKPTITATGSATCSITGKLKISPPLTNTNTVPSTVTGKLKGTCTGTTEGGVSPAKIKIGLTQHGTAAGTCNALAAGSTDPFTLAVTWKGSGGHINPSTATVKGFQLSGTPNFGFDLPNSTATVPKTTVTGSYPGVGTVTAHAHIAVPDTSVCNATTKSNGTVKAAKGIKKIAILPGSAIHFG